MKPDQRAKQRAKIWNTDGGRDDRDTAEQLWQAGETVRLISRTGRRGEKKRKRGWGGKRNREEGKKEQTKHEERVIKPGFR